jgi:D-alanyl-D-alanine carboxypeptidase/D-alanyl-D-alanine-endopeptidase (penicillin-binding protein 4)
MAVAKSLQDLGLLDQGWKQVDGSGLSRDNLVTARQITALIEAAMALDTASASAFHDSLAVPGEDGTLERRMGDLGERLRAKTGFINGTSALSGLVDTKNGRTLVFSILVQYPAQGGLNTSVWKPMQNEICRELARVGG